MEQTGYQHEIIVPNQGFPFKLFLFEGHDGKYFREKHWHRSIEIFAVQEGQIDFFLNEKCYCLSAGEFIIVNSNEVHAIHAPGKNVTIVLQMPLNLFESYYTADQFIWFSHNGKECDGKMAEMIGQMYSLDCEKSEGLELKIFSIFYELQYLLVTEYRKLEDCEELRKNNKQLKRLGVITGYIREHYAEEISLKHLAEVFGYTPAYLSRMFIKYAKINYKDYLQGIRLEHAKKELAESDRLIGEIALDHGFPNSKAFSNLFRRRYGILPNEYRKKIKK